MFNVYDNNKPASSAGFPNLKYSDWARNSFASFQEALSYAKNWLGQWDNLPDGWDGSPHDYSSYGDTIEIRKEE